MDRLEIEFEELEDTEDTETQVDYSELDRPPTNEDMIWSVYTA